MLVGGLAVVVALTLLLSGVVVLAVNDTFAGIVAAGGNGIHGSFLVTELDPSGKAPSTFGTFTSDDGSIVLTHT